MTARAPALSIVVPALNEAPEIAATLDGLQPLRARGAELLLVDGGSTDGTPALAAPRVDVLLTAAPGRARQMNAGAEAAAGQVLLFLHADTRLPPDADRLVLQGLQTSGRGWGRFDVRLSGARLGLRLVERGISWRSRLTGVASGDQAIFVRRDWFRRAGGFPDIPLMEDVALSRALKRLGPPLCLRPPVVTSSRRWEQHGLLRTVLLMWRLRLAYYLGASPERLAAAYRRSG